MDDEEEDSVCAEDNTTDSNAYYNCTDSKPNENVKAVRRHVNKLPTCALKIHTENGRVPHDAFYDADGRTTAVTSQSNKENTVETECNSKGFSDEFPVENGAEFDVDDVIFAKGDIHCEHSTHSEATDVSKSSDLKLDTSTAKNRKFSFRRLTREQIIILIFTSITNLLSFLTLSILAPFFPKEANKKGVSDSISGWIFGIFALVQFLASPIFGKILPIVGTRFMYISGLFVCGSCTLMFGFLDMVPIENGPATFIALCFLVRIVLALGCTGLNNAGFVLIVRAFPNDVAQVFGIGEIFVGAGMVIGPAIGGFLYSAGGFLLPFAVPGGLCLAATPLVWWALPHQDDSAVPGSSDLSWVKLLVHPESVVNSVGIVLAASIWAILDPTLEPHLRVFGLTPAIVGVLFLIMAACYSLTSPLWGWIADRIPDNRALLIPGFILATIGLLLLGPSELLGFEITYNELSLTIVALVIVGVACALCIIPTYDIYIGVLGQLGYPEDTRTYGMISGLWVAMYALGEFIGPSLGGVLFDTIGFEWMTTYFAGACLVWAFIIAASWFLQARFCKPTCPSYTSAHVDHVDERTHLLCNSITGDSLHTLPDHLENGY